MLPTDDHVLRATRMRRRALTGLAALSALALVATLPSASLSSASASAAPLAPSLARAGSSTSVRVVKVDVVDGRPRVVRRTVRVDRARLTRALSVSASGAGAVPPGYEVDHKVRATSGDDPLRPQQWGLKAIRLPRVWDKSRGRGITVAVVDSGVRGDHQDLAPAIVPGLDLVAPGGGDGTNDQNGHGTHVAGIIGARAGNGIGIAGGAPSVKIMPIRVLDANGAGYTSDVAEGIVWAADQGARVINLSLGGPDASSVMQEAMQYAKSKGAVVVVAAGNNAQSGNPVMYPASYPEAIAVAAVDNANARASFSSYGSYVDIAAPGVNILAPWSNSTDAYAYASGTSMATPFISAVAALMFSADASLTPNQIRRRMMRTALDLGTPGVDSRYGAGLVRPGRAVQKPVSASGVKAKPKSATGGGVRSLLP